jgi:hypothetical protein
LPKEFLVFGKDGLLDSFRAYGKVAGIQKATDNAHLKNLNEQFKVIKKTATITTKLTADELAKLKAKQLQLAIDKGNLALAQGADVFDLDKIQNAAALTNQAEQLGKATSSSQILQIANDTARLNVKKSMLALEDAIASKDEAAIAAATAKLNADLGILNALTGQNTQISAIKSILEGLIPKELIDQNNLNDALKKIKEMVALLAQVNSAIGITPNTGLIAGMTSEDEHLSKLAKFGGSPTLGSFSDIPIATAAAIQSGNRYAAQAAHYYNITVQANTIANPDELTNLIQDSLIKLNRRGDALTQAGSL